MNRIVTGTYKNERAIILENDLIKLTLLPGWGSKIVSIIYKPLNYETLWQNPGENYIKTGYGEPYEKGEFSGFDEMFPSISRCIYEGYPWAGIEIPDHGEVWSIPWDYGLGGDLVRLWVNGVRFPYQLEKRVFLEKERIYLKYRAINESSFDLDFIWAAHPLFNAAPGMEFIVPGGMDKVINSVPGPRLKEYGKVYDFPIAKLFDGRELNLGIVPERNDFGYQKYYFSGKMTEGWCILYDRIKKLNIGLTFPEDRVPYLGVWVNEGGWEGQYNIAPEPATGAMDRIDFARIWGMNSVLKAKESMEWYLNVSFKEGERTNWESLKKNK